jgi:mono/diheme cytochrome c family protein
MFVLHLCDAFHELARVFISARGTTLATSRLRGVMQHSAVTNVCERMANAAVCVALIGGFAANASARQKTGPASPSPVIESMYGPDLYRHYCATCHGREGKGDGPARSSLKVPPSDLTVLARRQKGVFPASTVETIIRGGTTVAAHGSVEMPVWGPIFYALDPSDARVKARIAALVSHIATIQQK